MSTILRSSSRSSGISSVLLPIIQIRLEEAVLKARLLAEGEALPADAAPHLGPVLERVVPLGLERHHRLPRVEHLAPVAGLGRRRQVPVPEDAHRLGCDAPRLVLVSDERRHRLVEVRPVAFHFDVVLLGT